MGIIPLFFLSWKEHNKMKLFALLCCVAVASATVSDEFRAFKTKYNKAYKNEVENAHRMKAFADNLGKIAKHNKEAAEGKHTYTLGVNKFADLTEAEWRETLTMNIVKEGKPTLQMKSKIVNIPDEVDWRDEGYVTPVKDQAQCGSCWAFSTTGSMEGALMKANGELVSLSEQNLVDCDPIDSGCNGGLMENAFAWIMKNGGINTEEDYPYEARDKSCRFDENNPTYTISAFHEIKEQDEDDLTEKIATEGPISVAIDAGKFSFQLYHDGVYYEPACSSTRLNHGVLAFGYGNEGGDDFYWVKNSWGTGWGDNGYIKMSRGRGNNCGIATDASWPVA